MNTEKIFNIAIGILTPLLIGACVTAIVIQLVGCSSFKVYDKSNIKEENIFYSTLAFYAQKDEEKNDVVIKQAMDKLYDKLNEQYSDKQTFCKQVAFGEFEIDKKDVRYINYMYCLSKKIKVEK